MKKWDPDNCGIALIGGAFFMILAAVYIGIILWLTPWLDGLPFSPWRLMVPVASISLIVVLFSGWIEDLGAVSFVLALIPLAIVTSPVWIALGITLGLRQRRKRREEEQREKETREKMEHVLKQLVASDADQREGQRLFEEDLWPNLGVLPKNELTNAFARIANTSPPWGLGQVRRALFWGEGDEVEEDEKVQAASWTVLRERLAQPAMVFAELAQLMSGAAWDTRQIIEALGRAAQESGHDGVGDICAVYALLQAAPGLCTVRNYRNLLPFMADNDWTWADEWLSEIFPGWPGWEAVSHTRTLRTMKYRTSREQAMLREREMLLEREGLRRRVVLPDQEMFQNMEIPGNSDRIRAIENIAVRVLQTATELPYGRERYLTYSLIYDLEQVRFERDMVALVDHGANLFALSSDSLLYPQLVTRLRDLIQVCKLLHRSQRSGLVVTDRLAFYASALGVLQSILQVVESDINPPDRWFLRRIVERWLEIITGGIAKMKAKAELEIELTGTEPTGPDYVVHIKLHNRASGLAERVRLQFDPDRLLDAKGVHAQNDIAEVEFIRGGQTMPVRFRLSVDRPGTFRLPFRVEYDDLEREGKMRAFADEVSFFVEERSFRPLKPNPYIAGPPLRTSEMFFGREEIFWYVEQNLPAGKQQNVIALHGERRTGKTSILYQLKHRLPEPFVPILIDLQGAPKRTADVFWHYLAKHMYDELQARGFSIKKPELAAFGKEPVYHFDAFLKEVYRMIQDKRPVLLIDEFDVLENEVRAGTLPKEIFDNLRHIMQHTPLCFIFAGTYDITKLGEDYWSVLFNTALWKHIELLDRETFQALVKEPVREYFEYDAYALDRIWEMTSGHPFFVQLLCRELVNYGNEHRLMYFTVQDVNNVIEDVVDVGQIHLSYMWDRLALAKKQFLVVVSELLETKGVAVLADIRAALTDYNISLDLEDALKELKAKAILEEKEGRYNFPIGLVRKWIYETKSLESLL